MEFRSVQVALAEEYPSVSIDISTVFRLGNDSLTAHLLGFCKVCIAHGKVVSIVVESDDVIGVVLDSPFVAGESLGVEVVLKHKIALDSDDKRFETVLFAIEIIYIKIYKSYSLSLLALLYEPHHLVVSPRRVVGEKTLGFVGNFHQFIDTIVGNIYLSK